MVDSAPPLHYSSLARYRELFRHGVPIFTYHKLGPRPRSARIKGLYVGAPLFARQLRELRRAGITSASLEQAAGAPDGADHRVVLTFDDGFANVLRYGQTALAEGGFHAIQFLVADRIGGLNDWEVREGEVPERLLNEGEVLEWLRLGHEIGSHSLTHPWLTRIPLEQAREEVRASKKKLEDRFGRAVHHFCYPYGDWNAQIRDMVREAGYRTACTIEWGVNDGTASPYELRRIAVRYPTRSLRQWGAGMAALWRR